MQQAVERFVRFSAGRLLVLNVIAVLVIKLILPFSGGGLADIVATVMPLNTDVVIAQTNAARAQANVAPLRHSSVLDAAAQAKLNDMAAQGYFAHVSPVGEQPWDFIIRAGYSYRAAGENLAKGFTDPTVLVQAWLASPTHRQNIVNPAYKDIGVATRRIMINGTSSVVVVQMFGTPLPTPVKKPVASAAPKATPARTAQAVSTDPRIGTSKLTSIPLPSSAAVAQIGGSLSRMLALYLACLAALLLAAAAMTGFRRAHLQALMAHGALLAFLVLVPAVHLAIPAIF